MKYREIGDVPYDVWVKELERVGSPLLPYSMAMYDVLRGHTALALAQMWQESQYETDRDLLKFTDYNPFNMKEWPEDPRGMWGIGAIGTKPTGVGGPDYLTFESPIRAAQEWRRRVIDDPSYKGGVYKPDMTLEQYIETFAPSYEKHPTTGEDNSSYPANVVTMLKRYGVWKEGTPVAVKFEKRLATNRYGEYSALANQSAAYFTIHENGNPASSPYDEAGFVKSGGGSQAVMYHFAVGVENGQPIIVQIFPVNKRGKHAGNATGNSSSAAVEVCQAPPGATSDQTQEALQELLYMLYTGDDRIEGIANVKFSPDRTLGHKDWAGANPACPATMKAKWGGVEPVVKKARARLTANPNPEPGPNPIPGVPAVIPFLFGAADGYKFDPNGTISKDWMKRGEETGSYPRLVGVHEAKHDDTTIRYFQFSSGLVISANLKTGVVGPWKYVP